MFERERDLGLGHCITGAMGYHGWCLFPVSAEVSSFLLFATQKDVRRLALDSSELADVVIPLTNVSSVVGVEYDSASDTVYWTDVELDIIGRAHWDGSMEQVSAFI